MEVVVCIMISCSRISPVCFDLCLCWTFERGFVNVAPDPSDARVRLVSLSPLGRQSVDAFRTAQSDVQARVQAKLGTERLKNFRNILGQIVGSIS